MDISLLPRMLMGNITAPPSKSLAHRLLITAAFSGAPTRIQCTAMGQDLLATIACLRALGADILVDEETIFVTPASVIPDSADLPCGESGSTLRFLLPIAGALGVNATFYLEGRLSHRPISPLWEEMERMGCKLGRPTSDSLCCSGKLRPGAYYIDGSVSSQFISGLMMALPLIDGKSSLQITGTAQSQPYIEMTRRVLQLFKDQPPLEITVEGDWSNAAFWITANALGSSISISGLSTSSAQGDKEILSLLPELEENATIPCGDIPDLVPILAVAAAAKQGAVFHNIQRLRLKESDRVASTIAMITSLGGHAKSTDTTLTVYGTGLTGGTVDSFGDHRIAMAAAIAATVCTQPVNILGAQCVAKSYPHFWEDYARLGGKYEKLR